MRKEVTVNTVKKNFYLTLLVLVASLTVTYIYARPQRVIRVVNGNQLVLSTGKTVCLAGVGPGRETEDFMRELVGGKAVQLRYDQMTTGQGDVPRAYVYLLDGTFVNAEVIKGGYARVDTTLPFKYSREFTHYQVKAREERRGIWSR